MSKTRPGVPRRSSGHRGDDAGVLRAGGRKRDLETEHVLENAYEGGWFDDYNMTGDSMWASNELVEEVRFRAAELVGAWLLGKSVCWKRVNVDPYNAITERAGQNKLWFEVWV